MFLDRVEQMNENEKRTLDRKERAEWTGEKIKQCPKCFNVVRKNKYGSDEYCSECGTEINWEDSE